MYHKRTSRFCIPSKEKVDLFRIWGFDGGDYEEVVQRRPDFSEEYIASIFRVEENVEIGLPPDCDSFLLGILFSLKYWRYIFLPKRRSVSEIHGVTTQNTFQLIYFFQLSDWEGNALSSLWAYRLSHHIGWKHCSHSLNSQGIGNVLIHYKRICS
jgi:hypothetical protein